MIYYNPHQAANLIGISKQTLIRWEKKKKIPLAKRNQLNQHRVYTNEDIEIIKQLMGLDMPQESQEEVEEKQCQKL